MGKRPAHLSIILIIILGICVYANSLHGKFLWDDTLLIKDNVYIKNFSYIKELFTKDIVSGAGIKSNFYRPVQMLTYMFDYSIRGLDVIGYHLTNVILHILAGLGIYWLVYVLFKDNLLSFLTGILFVVHPIHTEAVSYISGRADSLSLVFMLLCLILYVRKKLYFVMLLCYALALLSRENSLILPALLLLYHWAFKKKLEIRRFLPILAIAGMYIIFRLTVLNYLLPHIGTRTTLFQRLPGFFVAITNYFKLLLFPFGLHMEYGNKLFNLSEPKAMLGIIIAVLLLIYAFKRKRSDSLISFSILWFFIALLPVSNLYPLIIAYMAEHWLYVPSIGFFLILAKGLSSLYRIKNIRVPSILLIVGLLLFYSYLTIKQNTTWREPIAFCERTLKYAPDSVRTLTSLAIEYKNINKIEKAITYFKRAIEANPNYAYAYNNLGITYNAIGKTDEAIASYKKAIEINPNYAHPNVNLGNVYAHMGKYEDAIISYKKAIKINPVSTEAYNNLANAYSAIGKNEEAIALYKKVIEINPDYAITHYNLSITYYFITEYELAIKHCDKAIKLGFEVSPEFLERLKPYRR